MHYQWNWMIFWDEAPEGSLTFFDTLVSGLCYTLMTAALAWIIALLIGIVIGALRITPNKTVARLTDFYIGLFRHVPLLIQLFLWYSVIPKLLPADWTDWIGKLQSAPMITGILCMAFFTSARVAMLVSHGLQNQSKDQAVPYEPGEHSLTPGSSLILLPPTLRLTMPAFANEAATAIKNSSVALTIGILELTASARSLADFSFLTLEAIIAATLIYIGVSAIEIATECMTCVDVSRFYR